jgi:hypothetical protein
MRFFGLIICATCLGCSDYPLTSKWAMDDADYREKYSEPYGDGPLDKPLRMLKQSVDARHLENKSGNYIGGAYANDPNSGGIEIGAFNYSSPQLESRLSLAALAGTGREDWFIGANTGLRLQAPSRIAPFVGVGAFAGLNWEEVDARNDRRDNDDDGAIDELGETKTNYDGLVAVYPEVGIHYWLGTNARLTASASYWVTTAGRDDDFWFIGAGISFLHGPSEDEEDED